MNNSIDYAALGARVRLSRQSAHLTQEQLSELCSLSCAHIGHIERGTRIPSLDTLCRISEVLGVSLDYLIMNSSSENIFSQIDAALRDKPADKRRTYIAVMKALAEKIDEL